jgi:hypothetical protein
MGNKLQEHRESSAKSIRRAAKRRCFELRAFVGAGSVRMGHTQCASYGKEITGLLRAWVANAMRAHRLFHIR